MGIEDLLPQSVESLNIKSHASVLDATDPTFVLDPEFRPQKKHNEFEESLADQIPTLDLSPLWSTQPNAEEARKRLVEQVGNAAEEWGFFQVVNHGVPLTLIDNIHEQGLAFFSLPLEKKNEISRTSEEPFGYYYQELTKNHRDWKEVFDFLAKDEPLNNFGPNSLFGKNRWPSEPAGLRDACLGYSKAVDALGFQLLGLLSQSLGLEAEHFHKHFITDSTRFIRINYYPPCPIPDRALGVSHHKDASALTILVQDETGGLQVKRKDGAWINVKPRRDTFVINVGDVFQVWSNGKYRSIEHRAVVNEEKARFSFPLFFTPGLATDVFPVPKLVDEKHPPKYSKYNYGYFMKKRSDGNHRQEGENIQIEDFAITYE